MSHCWTEVDGEREERESSRWLRWVFVRPRPVRKLGRSPHLKRSVKNTSGLRSEGLCATTIMDRTHLGLGDRSIVPYMVIPTGPVKRRARLGGVLNFHYREAA